MKRRIQNGSVSDNQVKRGVNVAAAKVEIPLAGAYDCNPAATERRPTYIQLVDTGR